MFTGLVEEKGTLKEKIPTGDGFQFIIEANIIMKDLQIGNSVAVNGCCLTIVKIDGNTFAVDTIEDVKELSNSHWLTISFPEQFKQYLIYVGSVAIDGVSMTVAELKDKSFSVGIIPHTWKETIFADKKIGDTVNLEFDVLGKYVERIMESKNQDESSFFLN